jgi:hypothetical protein
MKVGVGATRIPARTVVGVVADTKQVSLSELPAPAMYVPYTQNEIKVWPSMQAMQYVIRVKADAPSIDKSIQQAVHTVDPDLPVANFTTLSTLLDQSLNGTRFTALLLVAFGAVVLILAAIGLYGAVSCSVSQRTLEIGVRIALGAKRAHIFAMVLAQSARPVCLGIAAGLMGAFASTRMMSRFLFGVRPTDPFTFAAASFLLISVSLLAGLWPARRAMRVDPMVALRSGTDNGQSPHASDALPPAANDLIDEQEAPSILASEGKTDDPKSDFCDINGHNVPAVVRDLRSPGRQSRCADPNTDECVCGSQRSSGSGRNGSPAGRGGTFLRGERPGGSRSAA